LKFSKLLKQYKQAELRWAINEWMEKSFRIYLTYIWSEVWIEFNWLRIGTIAGLLRKQ